MIELAQSPFMIVMLFAVGKFIYDTERARLQCDSVMFTNGVANVDNFIPVNRRIVDMIKRCY